MAGLIRRFWGWLVAAPLTLYGIFALIRDEFLPGPLRDQLRIGGLVGKLVSRVSWEFWIIGGLLVALVITNLPKLRRVSFRRRREPLDGARLSAPDMERIGLAPGHSMAPADDAQEYVFTVINESGADIAECYVTLDRSERRWDEQDEWEVEQVMLVDSPFRWNKPNVSADGRLWIQDGDRASFTLGRSTYFPAMDAKTRKHTGFYQFTLTLHESGSAVPRFELLVGHFYRLLISIRSRDSVGKRLPDVRYELHLKPTASAGPAGGLDVYHMQRVP